MTTDIRSCSVCAWRRDCRKKFGGGEDLALRCVEFEFDISLKKEGKTEDREREGGEKPNP